MRLEMRCPTELFYYQNPGGSVEQMVGAQSNTPYTSMKTAFRYRKEYVQGCSCKAEEFNAGTPAAPGDGTQQQGAVTPAPASPAAVLRRQRPQRMLQAGHPKSGHPSSSRSSQKALKRRLAADQRQKRLQFRTALARRQGQP